MKNSDNKALSEFTRWMMEFNWDPAHMKQVARLSMRIFDELEPLHKLSEEDRFILESAAILHDIGFLSDEKKHHKKAYRLIMEQTFPLISEEQKQMIALTARYHRKSPPKMKHKAFRLLDTDDRERIRKMAAVLRLADGLDRSHTNVVEDITCRVTRTRIFMNIHTWRNPEAEIYGASKKSKLFKEVFNRDIVFRVTEPEVQIL